MWIINEQFGIWISFQYFILSQAAIKKASEVEADYQKTIEKLEGEIKSREADIDKQKLEHQVRWVVLI